MLSTPPAFILSQDQTLMLKVDSRSGLLSLANYPKPSLLGFCSEFSQKSKGLNQTFCFLNFQGFTYCLIFNYQGSLLFLLLTARLFYHNSLCLSRAFLIIFCYSSATQSVYHASLLLSTTFLFFSNSFYLSHCFHNGTII